MGDNIDDDSDKVGDSGHSDDCRETAADNLGETTPLGHDSPALTVNAPEAVGPYRFVRRLGSGGMGEVWLAGQNEPVSRQVAIKIIKRGMDSDEVLSRFEAERQSLALMQHPNIAAMFDAGQAPSGQPYFVMEYVDGEPITDYCDRHQLDIDARLNLFIQVCSAIHHAHQKTILHRDLKPSNILVTEIDGEPKPKIIDFGIARALDADSEANTRLTRIGSVIGTPEYMPPEQARSDGADVDIRSDVYSLSAILYELLCGALPVELDKCDRSSADTLRAAISKVEPRPPSKRLTPSGQVSDPVLRARQRGSSATGLSRRLRGDLDWIVIKGLDKDRTRRYGSAAELAADLQRHLNGHPVQAGPPSAVYRARKFVRRHRWGVMVTALLTVAVIVGSVGVAYGLIRALEAERQARQEARAAEEVADFLVQLFRQPDPTGSGSGDITARELLAQGSDSIREALVEQPLIRARLLQTMAEAHDGLGLYSDARDLVSEALTIRQTLLPPGSPERYESRLLLAGATQRDGNPQQALELLDALHADIAASPAVDDKTRMTILQRRTAVLIELGDYETADAAFRELLGWLESDSEIDPQDQAVVWNNYGNLLRATNELEEAYQAYQNAARLLDFRNRPPDHRLVSVLINRSATQAMRDNLDEAIRELTEALPIIVQVYGEQHPETIGARLNLATFHHMAENYARAVEELREVMVTAEEHFGPDHPHVAMIANNLGAGLLQLDQAEAAVDPLTLALTIRRTALGDSHPMVATTTRLLARANAITGSIAEARDRYRELIEINRHILDRNHPDVIEDLAEAAEFLAEAGWPDEAEALQSEIAERQLVVELE